MSKFIRFFYAIALLIGCQSCFDENNKNINRNYSCDDKSVLPFFKYDTNSNRFYINNLVQLHLLNDEEKAMRIKENNFEEEFLVLKKDTFYLIDSFCRYNKIYKIFIYTLNLDNEINMLNIQLNSYENNKCIDAILLNQILNNETLYYSNFTLNSNNILITKYQIEYTEYDEDGDIIGKKLQNDTIKSNVKYKILKDGYFQKIE